MRTYLLAVFFLPLLFAPQEPGSWKEGSNSLPDTSSRKSKGDFGAMMIITDRYNEFLQEWARPETPQIHPSPDTLHRGDTVVAVIVFTGCKAVATKCNSTVDLRVFKPDGSLYGEHVGQVLWDGSPPTVHRLQLSRANLGIAIEPDDPLGEYHVNARVVDHNAQIQLILESRFSVAP